MRWLVNGWSLGPETAQLLFAVSNISTESKGRDQMQLIIMAVT